MIGQFQVRKLPYGPRTQLIRDMYCILALDATFHFNGFNSIFLACTIVCSVTELTLWVAPPNGLQLVQDLM